MDDRLAEIKNKIEDLKYIRDGYKEDLNYYLKDGLSEKSVKKSRCVSDNIHKISKEIEVLMKEWLQILKDN